MSRLIRMDQTGHTTLAEWTAEGYIGVVSDGPGHATQVRELPSEADLVVMRRPIAGG